MGIFVDHAMKKHRLRELKDVILETLADGDVLTYEAASAKWKNKPPAAGGTVGKGCKARLTSTQPCETDGTTLLALGTEIFDDYNEWDTTTYYFTPLVTGIYFIAMGLWFSTMSDGADVRLMINRYLPSSAVLLQFGARPRMLTESYMNVSGCCTYTLTAGYSYGFAVYQNSGSTRNAIGGERYTWGTIFRLF